MPKAPVAAQETHRSRPPRTAAPVSFKTEDEDVFLGAETEEAQVQEEDIDDIVSDMNQFLEEFRKRRTKKSTMATTAFESQKKAIYTSGRKLAQEVVRDALQHFNNLEATLLELKNQQWTYEQYVAEVIPLWLEQDAVINKLLESYDRPMDDVFPKRAALIASAENLLSENPARREKALKEVLCKAHEQLEESRKSEKAATDASKLIKHYKALLLA